MPQARRRHKLCRGGMQNASRSGSRQWKTAKPPARPAPSSGGPGAFFCRGQSPKGDDSGKEAATMTCETRRLAAFCMQEGPVRPGRDARRPDGLFESLPETSKSNKKRRGSLFPWNLFFGALEGTLPRPCGQSAGLSAPAGTKSGRTGCSSPFQRLPKATKKKRFLVSLEPLLWCAGRDSPAPLQTVRRTVRPGRDAGRPDGLFESLPETSGNDKKRRGSLFPWNLFFGALEGTRTPGLLIRSQTLYPAELPAQVQEV